MDNLSSGVQQKFQKIVDVVKTDLLSIRTGKASPQLIENVIVEAYGAKMKLVELATITSPDPISLLVTPFDSANGPAITKAIGDANLGLTAHLEENHVRVVVPSLSEERRMEYVKLAKTKIEGGKVMVRQARHEAMEEASKMEMDEDSMARLEKEIQKMTDETVEKLDIIASEKEKELMQV